ncbi:MAG: TIGR04255 family protein [Gemmatimonadaceae bacterium]
MGGANSVIDPSTNNLIVIGKYGDQHDRTLLPDGRVASEHGSMSNAQIPGTRPPEFIRPPVVEVAASIQFADLPGLDIARLGLLWTRFRNHYPRTDQRPALPQVVETFGAARPSHVGLSLQPVLPAPRLWFLDDSETKLVQVQRNRLIVNWRQLNTETEYPRYPALRGTLENAIETLIAFASEEGLGDVVPNQAELTYVNHIRAGEPGQPRQSLADFLTCWKNPDSSEFQGPAENVSFRMQYVQHRDDRPVGRLFVELDSAYTIDANAPIYVLNLIARGGPSQLTVHGALEFLDQAHEMIVRAFADITTSELHEYWGRTQ